MSHQRNSLLHCWTFRKGNYGVFAKLVFPQNLQQEVPWWFDFRFRNLNLLPVQLRPCLKLGFRWYVDGDSVIGPLFCAGYEMFFVWTWNYSRKNRYLVFSKSVFRYCKVSFYPPNIDIVLNMYKYRYPYWCPVSRNIYLYSLY